MWTSTHKLVMFVITIFVSLLTSFSARAQSGPANLNISGALFNAGGAPITNSNVTFKIEIWNHGATCRLYSEVHSPQDLSNTKGGFSLVIGTGVTQSNYLENTNAFSSRLFFNPGAVAPFTGCAGGVTLASGEDRLIRVLYDLGVGYVTMTPDVPVVSAPYSTVAETLQGKTPTDFILTNTNTSLSQVNVDYIFNTANYASLKALVEGTSTQYMVSSPSASVNFNGQRLVGVGTPSAATDAANKGYADAYIGGKSVDMAGVGTGIGGGRTLVWDQLQSKWVTSAIGGVASITAGTGLSGGTITTAGTFSVDVGTAAGQILQLNGSAQIPAVDGSLLVNVNATKLQSYAISAVTPADGQVMMWNNSSTQWEPSTPSGGTITALTGDVTASGSGSVVATIANSAVSTAKIADNAVTSAKIKSAGVAVNRLLITDSVSGTTVGYMTCNIDEILQWTASGWACNSMTGALPTSGAVAGTQGSSVQVPVVTVDNKGRVTSLTNVNIAFPVTSVAGRTGSVSLVASDIGGIRSAALEDVGTAAGNVVQLDGTGKLPTVDGSQLTGVNASKIGTHAVATTNPVLGQYLGWNVSGSRWEPMATGGGTVTQVVAGTGLQTTTITGVGTLNVDVGTTAGKIVQLDANAAYPAVNGYNITNGNAYNIRGAAISGAAVGNGNFLAYNTSGGVWSPVAAGGDVAMTAAGAFTVSRLQNNTVKSGIPGNGQVLTWNTSGSQWEYQATGTATSLQNMALSSTGPTDAQYLVFNASGSTWTPVSLSGDGSMTAAGVLSVAKIQGNAVKIGTPGNGQVLTWNGSGSQWEWQTSSGGSVTQVIAGTGLQATTISGVGTLNVDVGTTASKIVQLDSNAAYPAVNGYNITNGNAYNIRGAAISGVAVGNANFLAFNTSGGVWSPVAASGDVSMAADGSFTVSKIQGANISAGATNAQILAFNTSGNTWTPVSVGGDVTMLATGAQTVAKIQNNPVKSGTPTNGQVLTWNTSGSQWEYQSTTGGTVTQVIAGTGLQSTTISGVGTLNVDVGTAANKIVQLDSNAALPSVDGYNLTNGNAYNIRGAAISGAAVGNANFLAFNTSGNIWSPIAAGGDASMTANGTFTVSKLNNNLVKSGTPGNGQVLTWNGSGNQWEWQTSSGGSVTQVIAGTGLQATTISGVGTLNVDVGTTASKIVQLDSNAAYPAVNGYNITNGNAYNIRGAAISGSAVGNANFLAFNTSGGVWSPVAASGDVSMAADGSFTVSKIQGANISAGATNAQILAYNASGSTWTPVSVGGDVTMLATGAQTVAKIQSNAVKSGTPSNGQVLTWNTSGSQWEYQSTSGGTVTQVIAGTGLQSTTISGVGTLNVDVGTAANKIVQLDSNAALPSVDGYNLTNGNAYNIRGAAISGAAVGNANFLAFNTSGNIWSPIAAGGDVSMTANGTFTVSKLNNNLVKSGTPGNGQVLTWNGSGNQWEWQTSSGGSVTQVIAGTGLQAITINGVGTLNVDVGTAANKIVQLDSNAAYPAVNGYNITNGNAYNIRGAAISGSAVGNANFLVFNTSGGVWSPVAANGDVSMAADGSFTVSKIQGASVGAGATNAQILAFNASGNTWAPVSVGGDVTMLATGAQTVAKIQNNPVKSGTPTNGQVLTWNTSGSQWEYQSTSGGTVTQVIAGTGLQPATINGIGTLNVDVGTAANKIVQLDSNAAYPAVNGYNITNGNAYNIRGAAISGAAVGNANFLAFNTSGNIWSPIVAGGDVSMTADGTFTVSKLNNNLVKSGTPGNGQVLTWNGSGGQWEWQTSSGGSVTQVIAGIGLQAITINGVGTLNVDVGTTASKIVQLDTNAAYPAVNGYNITNGNAYNIRGAAISGSAVGNANFLVFNTSGGVWTPVAASGDVTMLATGVQTVAKIQSNSVKSGTPSNGQVLTWNTSGSQWEYQSTSGGTVTQVVAGTGLQSTTISGVGTLNVDVGTAANKIVQLDSNAALPSVDGYSLTNGNAYNIRGTAISGAAVGNANFLAFNTSGNIWSPIAVGGDVSMTANGTFTVSKLNNNLVKSGTPGNGQVLTWNGSGNQWEWQTSSGGSVTQVIAGTGLQATTISGVGTLNVDVGTTASKIVQLDTNAAYPAVNGYNITNGNAYNIRGAAISGAAVGNANFLAFNTSGGVWSPVAASGDVSMAANGSFTVSKIQGASVGAGATNAQILAYNASGSSWTPVSVGGDVTMLATGVQTVAKIQSNPVKSGTPTNGQVLTWNTSGSQWEFQSTSGGTVTQVIAGTGLQPATINGIGTLNVDVGTAANKIVQLDSNAALPSVDGYSLTNGNAYNIRGTAISGAAVGNANFLAFNTSGNIWSPIAAGGDVSMTANGTFTVSKLNNNLVKSGTPGNGQVLTWNSSGNQWEWQTSSGGSVTQVIAGTGLQATTISGVGTLNVDVGTTASKIVQLDSNAAYPAVNGYNITNGNAYNIRGAAISGSAVGNANFLVFNTSGGVWSPVAANGDVSMAADGSFTVSKIQGASVSAGATNAQILAFNASGNTWSPVSVGGDVTMLATGAQTVAKIQNNPVKSGTPTNGQVLTWNTSGSQWEYQSTTGGTVTQVIAGTGLQATTISGVGTLNVDVGTAANKIVQLDSNAALPSVDGYSLTNGNAYNIRGTAISGAAIGNANFLAFNTSGNIWSPIAAGGDVSMTANGTFTVSKLNNNLVKSGTPGNGQVLTWNSSGNQWEWQTSSGGSVTQVIAGTGLQATTISGVGTLNVDVGTTASKIVQLDSNAAYPAVNGYNITNGNAYNIRGAAISGSAVGNANFLVFNTSGGVWSPVAASGDVTMLATGVQTVAKIQSNAVKSGTPSNGQVLTWNSSGSQWEFQSTSGGTVTQVIAGTGLQPGTINGIGTLNVDVGTAANKIVQLDSNAALPSVDGYNLTNGNAYNIRGAAISGAAVGNANFLAFNMSGNIWSPIAAGGDVSMTSNGTFTVSKLNNNLVKSGTPGNGQVLTWNGSGGQWEWQTSSGGSVTQVIAGTGLQATTISGVGTLNVDVGTTASKIVQLDSNAAYPAVNGYNITNSNAYNIRGAAISGVAVGNANFLAFNTSGTIWSPVAASGDVSMTANGSFTVSKIQGASVGAGATNAQILSYNASGSSWTPVSVGGDVTMLATGAQTVAKIQNNAVKSGTPTNGQVLTWNTSGSQWEYQSTSGGTVTQVIAGTGLQATTISGVGTLNVDVGTAASKIVQLDSNAAYPAVNGYNITNGNAYNIRGAAISGAAVGNANFLAFNASGNIWSPIAAGGDVSMSANGTFTVSKLNNNTVKSGTPTNGQVLTWNTSGSQWEYQSTSGGTVTQVIAGTGLQATTINGVGTLNVDVGTVANKIVQLDTNAAYPAVNGFNITNGNAYNIRGAAISGAALSNANFLAYNSSGGIWSPVSAGGDVTMTADGSFTVSKIQGNAVKSGTPSNGQVLAWNASGSQWEWQSSASSQWNNGASSSINYTAGYIGIGTSSPQALLDLATTTSGQSAIIVPRDTQANRPPVGVNGMIRYNTNTGSFEGFANGAWGALASGGGSPTFPLLASPIGSSSAAAYSFTSDPDTGIYSVGADNLNFATNGIQRLAMDQFGNVSIGTTSAIFVKNNGAVGVGTSTPSVNLHVVSSSLSYVASQTTGTTSAAGFYAKSDSARLIMNAHGSGSPTTVGGLSAAGAAIIAGSSLAGEVPVRVFMGSTGNTPVYMATNNVIRMTFDSSLGSVGIGTTTPQALLDLATTTSGQSAIIVPRDTQANRPSTGVNGMIRYNTNTGSFEGFANGGWGTLSPSSGVSASGTGGAIQGSNGSALVSNNNIVVDATNGRMGIGTNAPSAGLQISSDNGDIDSFLSIKRGATDWRIYASDGTTSTPSFRIGGGNVGAYAWQFDWSGADSHIFRSPSQTAAQNVVNIIGSPGQAGSYLSVTTNGGGTTGDIMNVTGTGKVGIGTTTPRALLDLYTTTSGYSSVILPRDTTANRPSAGVSGMIRYNTTTNKFEGYENAAWTNIVGNATTLQSNSVKSGVPSNGQVLTWNTSGSQWEWQSSVSSQWNNGASSSINYTAGNVGIGTASPSYKLDINTSTTGDGIRVGQAFVGNHSAGSTYASFANATPMSNTGYALRQDNIGGTSLNAESGQPLTFNIANVEKVRLEGNNLGIGDTSPDANLEVVGTVMVSASAAGDGDRLIVNSSGNVGIGTTTPRALLDLVTTTSGQSAIIIPRDTQANRPAVGVNGMIRYNTNTGSFEGFRNGGWSNFSTGGSTQWNNGTSNSINYTAGNVGIGTVSANAGLNVGGGEIRLESSGIASGSYIQLTSSYSGGATTAALNLNGPNVGVSYLDIATNGNIDTVRIGGKFKVGNMYYSNGIAGFLTTFAENNTSNGNFAGFGNNNGVFASGYTLGWSPTALGSDFNNATNDTGMSRLAAGKIGFGNGNPGDSSGTIIAGKIGVGTTTPQALMDLWTTTSGQSAIIIPRDTQANRPPTGVNGMIRYNTNTSSFEGFANGGWGSLASGGATVSGTGGAIQASNGTALVSNNNIVIDTTNGRLGVGLPTPTYGVHVTKGGVYSSVGNQTAYTAVPTTGSSTLFEGQVGSLTNGIGIYLQSAISGALSNFSGNYIYIYPQRTHTGASTVTDAGHSISVVRANTINNASGTYNITGDLINFESNCTQTSGTCNDSSAILLVNQKYPTATGPVFKVQNSGTGPAAYITGGNVGIGTGTPLAILDVATTTSGQSALIVPRDTQANRPSTGVNGMIRYNTNSNAIEGFANGVWGSVPRIVGKVDLTAQGANIGATTILTPTANSFYEVSCYTTITQAATTSSNMPACMLNWTSVDTNGSSSATLAGTSTSNILGAYFSSGTMLIYAKAGQPIQYSTVAYNSSGATSMQYALHIRIKELPSN